MLNDKEKYDFIGQKDIKYDGVFYTAVKTTGIFCLPSCRAKKPKKENVVFYDTREEVLKNGFRACKVCKS
jgi:methylphosphotriester-DNA--protein-cysteine methyltransferase